MPDHEVSARIRTHAHTRTAYIHMYIRVYARMHTSYTRTEQTCPRTHVHMYRVRETGTERERVPGACQRTPGVIPDGSVSKASSFSEQGNLAGKTEVGAEVGANSQLQLRCGLCHSGGRRQDPGVAGSPGRLRELCLGRQHQTPSPPAGRDRAELQVAACRVRQSASRVACPDDILTKD